MDYVKQLDILRKRNIELSQENQKIRNELNKLKNNINTDDTKKERDNEFIEKIKADLSEALENYKNVCIELENSRNEYQIKLKELSEMLLATRDFIDVHNDDKVLEWGINEVH